MSNLVMAARMIENEEWEDAVRMYKTAHDNGGDQRAKEGYQRAQRLFKQAGEKDYYKVLGIRRDSSKCQIKKVWREILMFRRSGSWRNNGIRIRTSKRTRRWPQRKWYENKFDEGRNFRGL
jgi:hypothetical protein